MLIRRTHFEHPQSKAVSKTTALSLSIHYLSITHRSPKTGFMISSLKYVWYRLRLLRSFPCLNEESLSYSTELLALLYIGLSLSFSVSIFLHPALTRLSFFPPSLFSFSQRDLRFDPFVVRRMSETSPPSAHVLAIRIDPSFSFLHRFMADRHSQPHKVNVEYKSHHGEPVWYGWNFKN